MAQRNYIHFYLNGIEQKVSGAQAYMPLADYLRYVKQLTGTKIVCAEGDCGACTVLSARQTLKSETLRFKSINSCISAVYLLDGCHVVTVEGLKEGDEYHVVQETMVKNHGAQCGYCTPGFVCAMTQLNEDMRERGTKIDSQKAKNYLTGNLCRCTGYKPIIEAAVNLEPQKSKPLVERYISEERVNTLNNSLKSSVLIEHEDGKIYIPTDIQQADDFISQNLNAKINSGGTDLGVLINKRKLNLRSVISLNNIQSLYEYSENDDQVEIGCRVTLEETEKLLQSSFPEFSRLIHIFASPQIKNTATLVGNIANGSPIGDTLPFLVANDCRLVLRKRNQHREVLLNDFYLDYKKFDLQDGEYIEKIIIPKNKSLHKLYKVSLRKDLDISAVTFAGRLELENEKIKSIKVAFGGVGPTVKRNEEIEVALNGKDWSLGAFTQSLDVVEKIFTPFSDVRGSSDFRIQVCKNLLLKFYDEITNEHFKNCEASI